MSRLSLFTSPMMLGFDELERLVERAGKAQDTYPPYNIERQITPQGETWNIALAVAGFAASDLEVTVEGKQLVVKGQRPTESPGEPARDFLHRGIANRQFMRAFVLAEGMEVTGAQLQHGLLNITLLRREPERLVKRIGIKE